MRGEYLGIQNVGGFKQGLVKIEHVYNPMPPVPGQVYPPLLCSRLNNSRINPIVRNSTNGLLITSSPT